MAIGRQSMSPVGRRLARKMKRTIQEWRLVETGDRIMVCVSGGKDSYALLDHLRIFRDRVRFPFSLVAVHLDQRQPGYDGAPLEGWLRSSGLPYRIVSKDTYSRVVEETEPGKAFCAVCSRLRRGILYGVAEELGCNKIALGHHRDDTLHTFMMNLFFAGQLRSMPACYRTQCDRFDVIRPFIGCSESDIAEYAKEEAFPILPCNLCGSQSDLKRARMREILAGLEVEMPGVSDVMFGALGNVSVSHLFDRSLLTTIPFSSDGLMDQLTDADAVSSRGLIQIE